MASSAPGKRSRAVSDDAPDDVESLAFEKISANAKTPVRGSLDAAGFDLFSAEEVTIPPGARACVKTDLKFAIPPGSYGRVAPRSGLAAKKSVDVGAGVVDADFRGNVQVLLLNFSDGDFKVVRGDRIAQLIIEKIRVVELREVETLPATDRGAGSFGSTGLV